MSASDAEGRIPFVDLAGQYRMLKPAMDEAVLRVLSRGDFILGEDVAEFEREFALYCRVRHAIGVGDGVDALQLALRALGIGPGDEVILPAHTFVATALAVWQVGARPVLVDVDPRYYTLDPEAAARAVTSRTKALLPVHLYGQPADMDPLLELARSRGLAVVEDAAQAHGAEYKGRRCGTLGDIGCFSFYPGKNLGAYGDGGGITTDRDDLAERIRQLRHYGQKTKNVHAVKGFNSRLDTVQAAVLRVKLPHLDGWNDERRAAATRYGALLGGRGIGLPTEAPWARHVWHLYVVQVGNREAVQRALDAAGIAHGVHYLKPVHLYEAFADLGFGPGSFPVAEALSPRILSLPMYPGITPAQVERVARVVLGEAKA